MLFSACAPKTALLTRSQLLMGHVPVNITIESASDEKEKAIKITEEAYALARSIEKKISEYQPDSEVSCLNRQAGKGFCSLSPETETLLRFGSEISRQTDHAFDLAFASLSAEGRRGDVSIEGNRAILIHPKTRIGTGSIGKGLILDAMIEYMRSKGITRALVDAGGDLRALGGPWKVGIQKPGGIPGELAKTLEIYDRALATSGNYEQPGHILDPRTGQKVFRDSSVTVLAKSHLLANGLSTAFYVRGEKESLSYLKNFQEVVVIWTDPDGSTRIYPPKIIEGPPRSSSGPPDGRE